jgi:hypothetical protein
LTFSVAAMARQSDLRSASAVVPASVWRQPPLKRYVSMERKLKKQFALGIWWWPPYHAFKDVLHFRS